MSHRDASPILRTRVLLLLFALAFVARLFWVVMFFRYGIGLDDMFQYDMLARSLASGHGYRWYEAADLAAFASSVGLDLHGLQIPTNGFVTTFRAPFFPAFLAAVYRLAGFPARLLAARVAQALVTASLAPLTVLLARELGIERRPAVIAGVAMAIYPILAIYPVGLVTENLFIPLALAGVWLLLRASRLGDRRLYLAAGLAFGAAVLTRSVIAAFLPIAAIWCLMRARDGRRGAAILLTAALLVTVPWAVRNSLLSGKLTFIETNLGYNLFIGYHPAGDGSFRSDIAIMPLSIMDDAKRDAWTAGQAWEFIRSSPERIPGLVANKWRFFWGLEKRALIYFYSNGFFGHIRPALLVTIFAFFALPFVVILTSAVPGFATAPDRSGAVLVLLLIAAYTLPHLLIMAEDRFHLALVPYLAVYASHAWSQRGRLFVRLATPHWRSWATATALTLFFVGWGVELYTEWPKLAALLGPDGWHMRLAY